MLFSHCKCLYSRRSDCKSDRADRADFMIISVYLLNPIHQRSILRPMLSSKLLISHCKCLYSKRPDCKNPNPTEQCCVIGLELYSSVEVEDFLAEEECVLRLKAVGCCLEECVFRFLVFGGSGFACRVFLFHQIE